MKVNLGGIESFPNQGSSYRGDPESLSARPPWNLLNYFISKEYPGVVWPSNIWTAEVMKVSPVPIVPREQDGEGFFIFSEFCGLLGWGWMGYSLSSSA